MDLQLAGKAILITGGSTGVGLALAQRLIREDARVGLIARGRERLEEVAEQLRSDGADVLAMSGDVTEPADLRRFCELAQGRWAQIDGLVNNAGTHGAGSFADHDDATWERDLALKVKAAIRLTRLLLPVLKDSRGAVLNTLAISGKAPEAYSTPSSVSRAAGLALTKALSRELAPVGIRVNAILIGVIESEQLRQLARAAELTPEQYYQHMAQQCQIPLGRVGKPEEFADLAAFLLSPCASYIVGTAVNIDGGLCPVV
jgi:NAD(P)-dependent dehydrogenase (short-subunit alcohol dehydrogenase family)